MRRIMFKPISEHSIQIDDSDVLVEDDPKVNVIEM